MTPIALIPARGGSKRLPGKNLAEIDGVSLVARAVRCAVQVERFKHIIVSSDSQPILDEAFAESSDPRLILHERDPDMAGDKAGIEPLMAMMMERFPEASHLVLLNPTSPFRRVETVNRCIDTAVAYPWDTVATISYTTIPAYVWRHSNDQGWLVPFDGKRPRSQDVPLYAYEHGACYVVSRKNVEAGTLTGGECMCIVSGEHEDIDIDTARDLASARGIAEEYGL